MGLALLILAVLALGFWVWRSASGGPGAVQASAIEERPIWLDGNGEFAFPVVGESFYQEALEAACGPKCEDGHEVEVVAELVQEHDNPHDRQAVAVLVDGRKVGHLSREAARAYRRRMGALGLAGRSASCNARITGGWLRERRGRRDEGSFGISLDLA